MFAHALRIRFRSATTALYVVTTKNPSTTTTRTIANSAAPVDGFMTRP